ncbi:MAG: hypothetical protein DCC71_18645 [Proteobacteria bacterium]|nr:MAG: hypothetical protein DCC71_18645 [Pseudomonadota bacterium]
MRFTPSAAVAQRDRTASMSRFAFAAALVALFAAPSVRAFEFQDGRLQIHGYFEEQIRGMGQDFSWSDDIDLAQWYNVLSTEIEYDIAPDGWGPFDVLSAFARVEVRYDCIWTRGCGMFPGVDSWGDRAAHLPGYKTSGRRSGMSGSINISDQDNALGINDTAARFTELRYRPVDTGTGPRAFYLPENPRRPLRIDQLDGFTGLFAVAGPDTIFEAGGDDAAYFYFSRQLGCKFGARRTPGGANGYGNQIIGPIDPDCDIDPDGALNYKPNPFNPDDPSPTIGLPGGSAELPGRPASEYPLAQRAPRARSQGVFYPSPAYRRFLKDDDKSDVFDQNFSQNELAWNRGGSQQDEKELKEIYLDMEFFDSRLWVRAGKQNIVWGKTELFRTTDQFNPQDLALASLPSLEESRIALWSVRGVWSFYDIGPLEDVRLEIAANLDDFEPADLGRCGEPFTALVACNKTTALWAHGLFGVALAGENRPEPWWEDAGGLEYGARLEFRAGRFSFQISDFFGYEDFPYVERITSYHRRVDLQTGRPLRQRSETRRGGCIDGTQSDCLPITSAQTLNGNDPGAGGANSGATPPGPFDTDSRQRLLENYPSNIQIFSAICATSIGFSDADPTACGQSVFNSQISVFSVTVGNPTPVANRKAGDSISSLLANAIAGNSRARAIAQLGFTSGAVIPFVPLNEDPCDRFFSDNNGGCTGVVARTSVSAWTAGNTVRTLNQLLTDEQEALLGCGPFWGSDCESDGIDLLNAEASVLQQSWPGIEGNYGRYLERNNFLGYKIGGTDPDGNLFPVPGTENFEGNLPASYWDGERVVQLPGSRGPGDPGYNPLVDGTNTGLVVPTYNDPGRGVVNGFGPAAGLQFRSEMAALSWNALMTLVAFSQAADPLNPDPDDLDPANPASAVPGQCSFVQPQYCSSVKSFFTITGAQRNSVRAGGNGTYGRRDFVWHGGGEGVLTYQKRNVLGFSLDFAEDVTKSNWGMEASWINNVRFTDNNSLQGVNTGDTFNLTISADRPTFINFLNPNRTFFFNTQIFFQYISNYKSGFVNNGPFNMLGTFTIQTGYFQDRLLPGITFVYDINSNSGAALPSMTYRFTENFSATIGMNFFWGRWEYEDTAIAPLGTLGNEVGRLAYRDGVENGLSVVRERDEAFLRLRYTF